MILVEMALCLVLLGVLVRATCTDFQFGKIYNSLLLWGSAISAVLDLFYYGWWAREFLPVFFSNFLLLVLTGILFYSLHIWAAGDSKLLFFIGLSVPGRWYAFQPFAPASSFSIVIYAFSAAFLWLIVLGVRQFLLQPSTGLFHRTGWQPKRWLAFYLCFSSLVLLFRAAVPFFLADFLVQNWLFQQAIHCFFLLFLLQSCSRRRTKELLVLGSLGWGGVLLLILLQKTTFSVSLNGALLGWALLLIPLRMILNRYSYQSVPTSSVKAGQILSASTILAMQKSQVKGLPQMATEDLEARLSETEAQSVKRWEKSKYGQPNVTLVRKVPFAIFILLGTAFFLIVGVIES